MKRLTFFNGVAAAAVLAFFSSVGFVVLTPILTLAFLSKLGVPVLALIYISYLFAHSSERVGRVATLTLWSILVVFAWVFNPPFTVYLLLHVGAVWLIRSLYFYSSIVPALMDLGLNVLSIATAIWAITQSGSVFLAVWCFFLVQALFVAIPSTLNNRAGRTQTQEFVSANFECANQRAEAAVNQLFAK